MNAKIQTTDSEKRKKRNHYFAVICRKRRALVDIFTDRKDAERIALDCNRNSPHLLYYEVIAGQANIAQALGWTKYELVQYCTKNI